MSRFRLAIIATLPLAAASMTAGSLAAQTPPDVTAQTAAAPQTKGEARLSKLLEGRVAGEPVRCIRSLPSQRMQTIDRTAYVYGSGNTIYVQRTRDPGSIDDNDALVIRRFGSTDLCRLDTTTTIDPFTGIFTGAVFFNDFVPYTRVKKDQPAEG